MKIDIYEQLFRMNQGFEEALSALRRLAKYSVFHRGEIRRFEQLSRETRAAVNSYLLEALGTAETEEAGRLGRKQSKRTDTEPI